MLKGIVKYTLANNKGFGHGSKDIFWISISSYSREKRCKLFMNCMQGRLREPLNLLDRLSHINWCWQEELRLWCWLHSSLRSMSAAIFILSGWNLISLKISFWRKISLKANCFIANFFVHETSAYCFVKKNSLLT